MNAVKRYFRNIKLAHIHRKWYIRYKQRRCYTDSIPNLNAKIVYITFLFRLLNPTTCYKWRLGNGNFHPIYFYVFGKIIQF